MIAYVRARFRLRVFGSEHLRIEPGQIFAPSHRSDNDVPVLIATHYPASSRRPPCSPATPRPSRFAPTPRRPSPADPLVMRMARELESAGLV
jgi:hypothetical protein